MSLTDLRGHIDNIDEQILSLLKARFDLVSHVAREKEAHGLPTFQPKREEEAIIHRKDIAGKHNLDSEFTERLFTLIFEESKRIQDET